MSACHLNNVNKFILSAFNNFLTIQFISYAKIRLVVNNSIKIQIQPTQKLFK